MKKLITILVLVIALTALMTGCGTTDNKEDTDKKEDMNPEDIGVDDVFDDGSDVNPPELPID